MTDPMMVKMLKEYMMYTCTLLDFISRHKSTVTDNLAMAKDITPGTNTLVLQ